MTVKKKLSDFIQVVPDALTAKECSQLIRTLNKTALWGPTLVGGGVLNREMRNCDSVNISSSKHIHPEFEEIDTALFAAAGRALGVYAEAVDSEILIQVDTGYEALRYKKNGFYKTHTDHFPMHHRTLSCSFALNDNYEGGEWGFFGEEVKIKAPIGSAVLFPSNFCFPHQILPVTKGTRYSVVTWFV